MIGVLKRRYPMMVQLHQEFMAQVLEKYQVILPRRTTWFLYMVQMFLMMQLRQNTPGQTLAGHQLFKLRRTTLILYTFQMILMDRLYQDALRNQ